MAGRRRARKDARISQRCTWDVDVKECKISETGEAEQREKETDGVGR